MVAGLVLTLFLARVTRNNSTSRQNTVLLDTAPGNPRLSQGSHETRLRNST
jgi:hypothetical protein